ncbi:MAG: ATP-dependent DNA helicase RecG [Pirellulales bacterium]
MTLLPNQSTSASEPSQARERLATPIARLRGCSPGRARLLAKLKLYYAQDLLFFFPRDYCDLTDVRQVDQLEEDRLQSVRGTVEEVELRQLSGGRTLLGVLIIQGEQAMRAVWFNQPFMQAKFRRGQQVLVSGKPRLRGLRWEMSHPRVTMLDDDTDPGEVPKLLPVYRLTEGVSQHQMRRLVRQAVEDFGPLVDEVFPQELLERFRLLPLAEALPRVHSPDSQAMLAEARRRFVFQELLILQLALALRRAQRQGQQRAPKLPVDARIDHRIRRLFPFSLTDAQQRAIGEISADMGRPWPMNRLLQGDVGSGKTVPAVYAMLLCVAHGHQAVLMAPTEVLARQHAETFAQYLQAARVRRVLLTGGTRPSERQEILDKIRSADVDLVIGTQAILQDDVSFAKLGLVVIDEQHKFGVRQRASLRDSSTDPHYLVMTATPIPRSITMTQFGDLDVSVLKESPPGRQPVGTYLVEPSQRERWWAFVRKKLREGRQAYVVTPLVEQAEEEGVEEETHSVQEAFEALANGELEAFRLGLIHGRMSSREKEAAMSAFRSGETQVLVSTSVIEVGVDVPNATVITIQGADRFGLSQLHQLRGRVARSHHAGFCGILADPKTDEASERLQAFTETTDGFQLAELDLRLRGPGDLFGTRQHGLPPLRIAHLVRDADVLEEARREAQRLVREDPGLARPEHARLRRMVLVRYGDSLELGDAG